MIVYPERFKQAAPAGFDGVFEWDFLKGAFGDTKIQPMDLDALVERRMNFLAFETKGAGVPIPQGQIITLESLVYTGFFTIIVTRGKTIQNIAGWETWYLGRKSQTIQKKWQDGDAEKLNAFVARWFRWANRNPGK